MGNKFSQISWGLGSRTGIMCWEELCDSIISVLVILLLYFCYGLNVCVPSDFLRWASNPQCNGIWSEAFERQSDYQCGALIPELWSSEEESGERENLSPPWEDRRQQPPADQEAGLYQTPDPLAPWPWASQNPDLWEINACCLSCPVYDILLQQLRLTKTVSHRN